MRSFDEWVGFVVFLDGAREYSNELCPGFLIVANSESQYIPLIQKKNATS